MFNPFVFDPPRDRTGRCYRCPNRASFLQSVIFDDLCTNFQHHEELDASNALITVTKTQSGEITGASLDISSETVGVVPITVPTGDVDKARTTLIILEQYCRMVELLSRDVGNDLVQRVTSIFLYIRGDRRLAVVTFTWTHATTPLGRLASSTKRRCETRPNGLRAAWTGSSMNPKARSFGFRHAI